MHLYNGISQHSCMTPRRRLYLKDFSSCIIQWVITLCEALICCLPAFEVPIRKRQQSSLIHTVSGQLLRIL